jgi:5'-deoxynucleotidase YfbR-like HD superfamily hydrolase
MSALLKAQLEMIGRSAKVKRYHTEHTQHTQTVGEHTYGVMWLVYLLTDGRPSAALLLHALAHDAPEYATGDVPAPVKKQGGIKSAFDALEEEVMTNLQIRLPGFDMNDSQFQILKLADCLEGAMFCLSELQRGNTWIDKCYTNYATYIESLHPTGMGAEIFNLIKEKYNDVRSK